MAVRSADLTDYGQEALLICFQSLEGMHIMDRDSLCHIISTVNWHTLTILASLCCCWCHLIVFLLLVFCPAKGGMVAICDVNEYRKCIKKFNVSVLLLSLISACSMYWIPQNILHISQRSSDDWC